MFVKVFMLGRPGSGKSTVADLIKLFASDRGWSTHYTNDYELLQRLFLQETDQCTPRKGRKFRPAGPKGCNGFDVTELFVLDTVLEKMRMEVEEVESESSEEDNILCLIEFARANYRDALRLFGRDLLRGAYLLFLDVDMECCIGRNHWRNDHFISDEIMNTYYSEDDWSYLSLYLQQSCGISVNTWEIKNTGSFQDLAQNVERLVNTQLCYSREDPLLSQTPHALALV